MADYQNPIDLIVADIDGCFTAGGKSFYNLDVCAKVRAWNEAAEWDASVPRIVFCTARPLPYVQCIHQVTGSKLPSVAECGALMWDPRTLRTHVNPAYTEADRRRFQELTAQAQETLVSHARGIIREEGKVCQLTLYPRRPMTIEELARRSVEFAKPWKKTIRVDATHSVVNFLPKCIDKGVGLKWLASFLGIPLSHVAGLGDADSDWDFLQYCGVSASPMNGRDLVRSRVDWRLESGPAECIVEFFERVIAHNRARTRATP